MSWFMQKAKYSVVDNPAFDNHYQSPDKNTEKISIFTIKQKL